MGRTTKVAPGQRYTHLTVVARVDQLHWRCRCDCGADVVAVSYRLTRGEKKSCGCQRGAHRLRHGRHKDDPTYMSWRAMRDRCRSQHPNYGGRGISYCNRWQSVGLTLDRIDVNGNYEPANCRWADAKTQRANRRDVLEREYGPKADA